MWTNNSVLPFDEDDCRLFRSYLRYALLSIAFWRFRQFNVRKPDAQRKDAHVSMLRRLDAVESEAQKEEWASLMSKIRRSDQRQS